MENPKVEPILLKGPSLKADFERLGNMDVEVMIFYCNMKTKELQPKYCGTQEMMNVAKNTELGKKFVNEFLACCEEINAQKKKIADLQKEADKNLLENMTLDMSVEEVVNEAVVTRIKEEEFSESTESETTEKEVGPVGKENDYMWSQMLTNFVRMVGEYENTQKNEKTHGQGSQSGADSMGAKNNDENQPKDEISGVKIKTEPIDPDDEMIPQANQNVIGMDYSNVNSQIAVSTGSSVSTTVAVTTSVLATALQSNFSSQSQNISNSNAHAVAGTSVSVGGPVGATSTGGVAVMPGSTPNSLSLKMIGNKLYFVLPCSMNVPLQQVVSKASVTQSITNPTGNPLMAVQNIGLPGLQGSTLAQNVPINTGAAANTFVSPQNIAIPTPTVNTSVQNVVLSNMGLVAGKTESLQNLVTPNMGLAANTQVPVLNVLPGATANTSDIGLTPRRILPQALQQTNTGQVPVLGTIEGTSAANSDKTLKSNVVMPTVEPVLQSKQTASRERKMVQTTAVAQRSGRKSPPCVEPSAKRQKTDAESLVSSKKSNSIQHTSKNDNISAKNTVTVAKDGDIVYNTYMLPSGVYHDGMPHIAAITTATAPSLQEGDTSTSPVPCSSKSSMSLPPGTSFDGGPTSADEQVCDDDDDDNVDDDENKDDDDEGGAENTTDEMSRTSDKTNDLAAPRRTVSCNLRKRSRTNNIEKNRRTIGTRAFYIHKQKHVLDSKNISSDKHEQNLQKSRPLEESKDAPVNPVDTTDTTNSSRFSRVTDEDLQKYIDIHQPTSTKINTKWIHKLFQDWHTQQFGSCLDMAVVSADDLSRKLIRFYCEAKRKTGEHYNRNTLKNIRAGLNRYLSDIDRPIDIVGDKEFKQANKILDGMLKHLEQSGVLKPSRHKTVIPYPDLQKIALYFQSAESSPIVLRHAVWYFMSIHFVSHGLELYHQIKISSLKFHTDDSGDEYVTLSNEYQQTHFQGLNRYDAPIDKRMYATGKKNCPIRLLRLLVKRTDDSAACLFNSCSQDALFNPVDLSIWFPNKPLSKRSFSNFMPDIAKSSGCEERYTAFCLRATAIFAMNQAGHHSTFISAHRNESSRTLSVEEKKRLSATLSSICDNRVASPNFSVGNNSSITLRFV